MHEPEYHSPLFRSISCQCARSLSPCPPYLCGVGRLTSYCKLTGNSLTPHRYSLLTIDPTTMLLCTAFSNKTVSFSYTRSCRLHKEPAGATTQHRKMKYTRLLVLRTCLLLVSVYADVSGQYAYEAYGVAEFRRESSTGCMTEVCELEGVVGTMQVQHMHDSHMPATAAQAAVFGLQEETGVMQLLGIATVTSSNSLSDRVSVNFNWQDARVVMLVYVRHNISNRDVKLMVREGKNTTKFFLGAPDQCILCRSSATVITGMEVRNSALTIKSAASEWKSHIAKFG